MKISLTRQIGSQTILMLILFTCIEVCMACNPMVKLQYLNTEVSTPEHHDRFLVVGIVQDSLFRAILEKQFAGGLQGRGLFAGTSFDIFGANGQRQLSKEDTYLKLCREGIDAVITIAAIPSKNEFRYRRQDFKQGPNFYFYQRLWNYRNPDVPKLIVGSQATNTELIWEVVLFDLASLEVNYCATTRTAPVRFMMAEADALSEKVIRHMLRKGVLKAQHAAPTAFNALP